VVVPINLIGCQPSLILLAPNLMRPQTTLVIIIVRVMSMQNTAVSVFKTFNFILFYGFTMFLRLPALAISWFANQPDCFEPGPNPKSRARTPARLLFALFSIFQQCFSRFLFKASNMLLGPFPAGDSCNMFPMLGVHGVYAL